MSRPIRIRLSRAKGFKLPPNTRSVSRPGPFGNPYRVQDAEAAGYRNPAAWCVVLFAEWLEGRHPQFVPGAREKLLARLPELRGKNLGCWCELAAPCHADVLLEIVAKMDAPPLPEAPA